METALEYLKQPVVQGVLSVLVAIIAAYAVEIIVCRSLAAAAAKTETDLDDQIIDALRRPIFLTVLLIGLDIALHRMEISSGILANTESLLETIVVIVWTLAIFRVSTTLISALAQATNKNSILQASTVPVFDIVLKVLTIGGAIYFIFLAWKIDVTAWAASAGILGIAISFAAKDTLANLFSGIFIIADRPYKIGDWIVLDEGLRGRVTRIGLRSTRILTRDDIEITVPNAVIGNSKIVNEAGGPYTKQRIAVRVEAAYGSDIDKVKEVLLSCPEEVKSIAKRPEPIVRFREFGASGLVHDLLVWLEDPAMKGVVVDTLNTKVYKRFAQEGIEIPYSKHDVYIKSVPDKLKRAS